MTSEPTVGAQDRGTFGPPRPLAPAWVGDIVAAVLIAGLALVPLYFDRVGLASWPSILLNLSPLLVLPLRRRWPVAMLAGSLAIATAAILTNVLGPGVVLAVGITMFNLANRTSRRVTLRVGGLVIVIVFVFSVIAAGGDVLDSRGIQFVLAVALAAAAGDAARSRREYIEAITERAERAERTREAEAQRRVTEERLRIARDLHDAVAHQIAVISLNAGVASSTLDSNPEKTRDALATIRQAARTVLGEIGDLMNMLRDGDATGQAARPQADLSDLDGLLAQFREAGLEIDVKIDEAALRMTGTAGMVAYRVVQEALTNVHKHGAGGRARLLVTTTDDAVTVVVTNPAHGPPRAEAPDHSLSTGVGLIGLRERVASVRGTVEAGPTPDGWALNAVLPLSKERAA